MMLCQEERAGRDKVDLLAHEWLGTPFHDHGRVRGAGTDCAQLLLCVFAEAGLIPATEVGYYSPQFFLHQPQERFLAWVRKFAREIPLERVRPGDVAVYKVGRCFAHGAIVIKPGWPNIIHAHFAARRVIRGNGLNPHLGTRVLDMRFFSYWHE